MEVEDGKGANGGLLKAAAEDGEAAGPLRGADGAGDGDTKGGGADGRDGGRDG